jgi:hypothetical protein
MEKKLLKVFEKFRTNFENRFNSQSILNLGEDSVRYDFFISIMNELNLLPHEIHLEYPINNNAYLKNNTQNAKRKENPQIDLAITLENKSFSAEFGLFKRNSNPESSINVTEKCFKMFNDMLRLALNSFFTPNRSYFICIADSKMLGKKIRDINIPPFPSKQYSFSPSDIIEWRNTIKSANKAFDTRFVNRANELNVGIKANLIFNELITNKMKETLPDNCLETRVLIYQVES